MAVKDDYQDFKVALNDLKLNSKPLINFLTILAEEKMHNAPQIVRAVEERILETKGDHVLPALYVLDSIVKNLRSSVYVQLFEAKLPVLFANAFNKVDERTRSSMFKLRQTWPPFFTNLSLYNLDTRTHDIDPAWPITARVPDPSPFLQNIHLNPNFLQRAARHGQTLLSSSNATLLNDTNHNALATQANTLATTTTPTHPFQQQLLQFAQQHAPQIPTTPQQKSSLSTFSNPSFPFPGFGNDAYRHVMQILATVGAPSSYTSNYNFLPYLPPLPPAPPSFNLVQNTFQSQIQQQQQSTTASDQQIFAARQSPPMKRPHDENNNSHNNNLYADEDNKRPRYDPVTGRATRTRNFDEENVAPVPLLIDANVNMLKKKYVGIVQQLYVGKFQCRLCGLRFTAKQKNHYTHHLDWHYLENKQEKDLSTTTSSSSLLQRSRNWYSSVQEWTIYEENIEEQIRTGRIISTQLRPIRDNHQLIQGENILSSSGVISCPAIGNGDSDDDRCYVCHDPFENFFDDNREEWHLKDAIRIDGKTYHPIYIGRKKAEGIVYEDDEESNEEPATTTVTSNDQSNQMSSIVNKSIKRERCPYGKFCYRKNPAHRQEAIHPGDPDWDNKENDTDDKKPECPYGSDCYRKNPDHFNEYSHTQKQSSINKTKRRTSKRKGKDDEEDDDDDGLPNEYDYNDSFIDDEDLDDSTRMDRTGI
ncbi:unnamed protein product [Rotaria sp. Silwood1]|nr:unnamed protein product [Rotaria sp. Silwood1]